MSSLDERARYLEAWQDVLLAKERAVQAREIAVQAREQTVSSREAAVQLRESAASSPPPGGSPARLRPVSPGGGATPGRETPPTPGTPGSRGSRGSQPDRVDRHPSREEFDHYDPRGEVELYAAAPGLVISPPAAAAPSGAAARLRGLGAPPPPPVAATPPPVLEALPEDDVEIEEGEGAPTSAVPTSPQTIIAPPPRPKVRGLARNRAGQESEIPNFKGSYLGRFPLVSANSWTSDHLLERSRSVDSFLGTRARGTLTLKRR